MADDIRIHFSMQIDGEFVLFPTTELVVTPGAAIEYGLVEQTDPNGCPVVLDAFVAAHKYQLGDEFTPETCADHLQMHSKHWLGRAFGREAFYSGYTINGCYAYDLSSPYTANKGYKGLSFDKARIQNGDVVEVFAFQDSYGMDYYTYFMHDGKQIMKLNLLAGESAELALEGLMFGYGGPMTRKDRKFNRLISTVSEARIISFDPEHGTSSPFDSAMTDDDGLVELTFDNPGVYYVSAEGGECRYNSHHALPWLEVTVS